MTQPTGYFKAFLDLAIFNRTSLKIAKRIWFRLRVGSILWKCPILCQVPNSLYSTVLSFARDSIPTGKAAWLLDEPPLVQSDPPRFQGPEGSLHESRMRHQSSKKSLQGSKMSFYGSVVPG
jgi:hypothetical protein